MFKNEFAKFLLKEWKKALTPNYWNIFGGKTLIASYGGKYVPENNEITLTRPLLLQGDHEEDHTLIAFHIANITAEHVIVRTCDTDVLVILIGATGQEEGTQQKVRTSM